jgi:hypothetical protein
MVYLNIWPDLVSVWVLNELREKNAFFAILSFEYRVSVLCVEAERLTFQTDI